MNDKPTVALFGASVRAMAQSAAKAGFDVFACDLFQDEDIVACCRQSVKLEPSDYPDGFRAIADRWAHHPRVFTGGLENFPDVVEAFANTGPLWGCSSASLRACRSPTALLEAGITTPRVKTDPADVPIDGSWLQKPTGGSAGRGIKPWFGVRLPRDCFLQERVPGEPCSALFVGLADRAHLIGASRQYIGPSWTGAPSFAYTGGSAPLDLPPQVASRLENVGESLRGRFDLRGLFGIDAVRNGEEWTFVEINPRPTASMELFERAGVGNLFQVHYSAFAAAPPALIRPTRAAAKAIFYATEPFRLQEPLPSEEGGVCLADRPPAGTQFDVGDPVATVLTTGDSDAAVTAELRAGMERLKQRLAMIESRSTKR